VRTQAEGGAQVQPARVPEEQFPFRHEELFCG
jgi:hypothetical protein